MYQTCIKQRPLRITALVAAVSCRKYDVESEAMRLFGEDLPTVVTKFRKSPEYVKILAEKLGEFSAYVADIQKQTTYYYMEKLKNRVSEMIGLKEEISSKSGYFMRRRYPSRKEDGDKEDETQRFLDHYPLFHSQLSVSERNSFKDLGFEFAGHIIHSLIKSYGAEDSGKSTRSPGGDGKSTTQHVQVHVVTTPSDPQTDSTVGSDTTSSNGLTYRQKSGHHNKKIIAGK